MKAAARTLPPGRPSRCDFLNQLARPFKPRWTFDPPISPRAAVPLGHDVSAVGADGGAVRMPPTLLPGPDLVNGTTMWTGVLCTCSNHATEPVDFRANVPP
jgi:hypothetical protein